ncbi:telomere binding protein [Kalmusia sp. IMI 367209]|nr:telomere binding protein [Kalmusia sp. IMI 367209]
MDDFLTPVSTTKVKRTQDSKPLLQETQNIVEDRRSIKLDSPDQALQVLKEQPDFESVSKVLRYLAAESERKDGFHLMLPEPVAASITYQLINTTIPDYWQILGDQGTLLKDLIRCLRNPCGIGNIVTRLRPLIADCRQKKPVGDSRDSASHIEDLLSILENILLGDRCLSQVWNDVETHAKNAVQKKMMWKEFITQIASGRIISLVAEAEDALKEREVSRTASWLANGSDYASWLGRNIASLMRGTESSEQFDAAVVDVGGKALTLGYTDHIVRSMLLTLIATESISTFISLLHKMKAFEQRKYLISIIPVLSNQYLNAGISVKVAAPPEGSSFISAIAALVSELVKNNDTLKEQLVTSLTKSPLPALDDSLAARRSVIAAIAQDENQLHTLLENSLKLFGNSYYIKHTPILQQEALAQTLAITSGYVNRSQPMFMTMMAKSTHQVSGMSNRIGSSSPRARFLGIAVGMAISKMVDKPEIQLKFDLEGEEAEEAQWYQSLTLINDKLGKISDLKVPEKKPPSKQPLRKFKPASAAPKSLSKPATTNIKGPRIVEILSDSDSDDDLIPYNKPDSDPEDDTDDPTEVNRNKPTAPVYIRDLIAGLRDTEDYDRHALALSTAAPLIRRKANFGTEVLDHIEELATILVGLHDTFELGNFAEQRQQALIAVLLAKPAPMAQWFARTFFTGDYSLTQRTAILTTLGLGARSLAGLKDTATEDIQLLSPLAAQAADALTGPSILKVRTFSSRMQVEARRSKPVPNALAQLVADSFFFPLTGRWWLAARASSSTTTTVTTSTTSDAHAAGSIFSSTHLVPAFLHTLALLMHASGPNTLALPQMTRELWELLLSVRGLAADKRILGALLFAFLMLLETNADKERLATEQGKELLETQEWVRAVFEGLPAGREGEEDEKVRVLAAGVVVRCQEVVEKYQRRLVGSLMDY